MAGRRTAKSTASCSSAMSAEYEIVLDISFLVDKIGAVDVSPVDPTTRFTSLELSTIIGSPFALSPGFKR
jgi:hypothetical protein